jgi:hypothetical protein
MQIVATSTEVQCKICRSPSRDAVDRWILARALREKDEAGVRVDMKYVLARMLELGITYPRSDNVVTHLSKHCRIVEDDDVALLDRIAEDLRHEVVALARQFDEQGPANADTLPDRVIAVYDLQMRAELRQGKMPRVTPDQVRAMIDTKTRRRQNERLTDLLDIHAAALTGSVGFDVDAGPEEFAELVE